MRGTTTLEAQTGEAEGEAAIAATGEVEIGFPRAL